MLLPFFATLSSMVAYDVISVFGSRLKDNGTFPEFIYRELDLAVEYVNQYPEATLALCGKHSLNDTRSLMPECDVAERYVRSQYPKIKRFLKEKASKTIQENWIYLRLLLEAKGFREPTILHITTQGRLPRSRFLGEQIFGKTATISFKAIPAVSDNDATFLWLEKKRLGDSRCILQGMKPGDLSFKHLVLNGKSQWDKLRLAHHASCPYAGKLHPSP